MWSFLLSKAAIQSSSHNGPINNNDAFLSPSKIFAFCAYFERSLWRGKYPVSIVRMFAPLETNTCGPLMTVVLCCKIALSSGLIYVLLHLSPLFTWLLGYYKLVGLRWVWIHNNFLYYHYSLSPTIMPCTLSCYRPCGFLELPQPDGLGSDCYTLFCCDFLDDESNNTFFSSSTSASAASVASATSKATTISAVSTIVEIVPVLELKSMLVVHHLWNHVWLVVLHCLVERELGGILLLLNHTVLHRLLLLLLLRSVHLFN